MFFEGFDYLPLLGITYLPFVDYFFPVNDYGVDV